MLHPPYIFAIVPAAGQSRRMGVHKQLLPFGGTTVIGHIVDALCRSRIDEVCVVAGHQADLIRQALEGQAVRIVVNPDYERSDMLASIRCGLSGDARRLAAQCLSPWAISRRSPPN